MMTENKHETIITVNTIAKGLRSGLISLVKNPQQEIGTVCQIGEYWFYFGGETAEEYDPKEFQDNVPFDDIVSEIYDTLMAFKEESPINTEYFYYLAVLEIKGYTQQKNLIVTIQHIIEVCPFGPYCVLMRSTDDDLLYFIASETDTCIRTLEEGKQYRILTCIKEGDQLSQIDRFENLSAMSDCSEVNPCCQDCVFRYEDFCARCNESGDPKDLQTTGKTIQRNDSCSHFASEPALLHLFADEMLHNRPEVNAVETIDYNPDSTSGGQFVFTDYAYADIIQMMSNCSDVTSFFEALDMISKQYCIDKGTQEFRDLVYAFLNEKDTPDFRTDTLRSAYQVMNAAMEGQKNE